MKTIVFSLFCVALVLPLLAAAHSVGFKTLTTETEDGYVVDFGYEEATLFEDIPTRLSFELYDEPGTTTLSSFTEVWVVIKGDAGTIFSGGIDRPEFGETGISFTFPQAGDYTVSVRYQEDNAILANGVFELTVPLNTAAGNTENKAAPIVISLFALVLGYLLGRFLAHR